MTPQQRSSTTLRTAPPADVIQRPEALRAQATAAASSPELSAARSLAAQAASLIERAPAFHQLSPDQRSRLRRDIGAIQNALAPEPPARALETPNDLRRNSPRLNNQPEPVQQPAAPEIAPARKGPATETIAARAGALSDEIDFPAFVAGLVHGTFDAIVDASIRQMEAFADLVGSVAKNADSFMRDNVSNNQVRDWLVEHHPAHLRVEWSDGGQPVLRARDVRDEDGEATAPEWLAEYGLEVQPLNDELVEQELVPAARRRVGESRQQMLATMVLLGMNRVVVRDGTIAAKVRFRAAAKDSAKVAYAVSADPGNNRNWGERGSLTYANATTMVSTVGINAQAESELRAELFGEVRINFASETLPLDRFVDQARLVLLQQHARVPAQGAARGDNAAAASAATPAATPGGTG